MPATSTACCSAASRTTSRSVTSAEVAAVVGGGAKVSLIDGEMTSWYGSRAIAGLEYLDRYADDGDPA